MLRWVFSFVDVGVVCLFAVRHDRPRHGTDDTNDTGRVTMGLRAVCKWRACLWDRDQCIGNGTVCLWRHAAVGRLKDGRGMHDWRLVVLRLIAWV